jgi:ABC-type multidrug transport system fused ATPase/permease subunit
MRLLRLMGRSRRYLGLAVILGVVQSALLLPVAYLVRHLFDVAIPHDDHGAILLSAVGIVGLAMIGALAGLTGQRLASRMARTTVADLRRALLAQLYAQPASWHDRREPGVLLQTVVHDTDRLTIWLGQVSSSTLPALIRAVALAAVAFAFSPLLTLCVAATLPVSVLIAFVLGNRSRRAFREYIDAQVRFGAAMHSGLRTLALSRVNGAQRWELSRHATRIEDSLDHAAVYDDANARTLAAQQAVVGIGGVLVLAVGSVMVAGGDMSLGNLLAFYAIGMLLLRQAGLAVTGFTAAAVNAEALGRVEEILAAAPPAPRAGTVLEAFTGAVSFDEVVFAYGEEPVLRGVTFDVAPGEHVSLMGPSGSGKSTIVALLLGLYEPQCGCVRLDGMALDTIDLASLRRQVGVILQDAVVFPGTIRENIAYGRDDVGGEEITTAVGRAGLDDFVAALPDGLDHVVGDEGGLVSGGQRQRIGIARALLGRPALLVLDEPTSQLDRRAIDRLLATLDELRCTIITVTHDADVAARADRIVHVRDGTIESIEAVAGRPGAVA